MQERRDEINNLYIKLIGKECEEILLYKLIVNRYSLERIKKSILNSDEYRERKNIIFNFEKWIEFGERYTYLLKDKDFIEPPLRSDNNLVFIDFRYLDNMEFVIRNALIRINGSFMVTFVCGKENYEEIKILCNEISKNIKVLNIDQHVKSQNDYNNLLLTPEFWKKLDGKKILLHQFDAFIFKDNIEDFLEYDYLGAPMKLDNGEVNFNGGFSFRNKEKMIELLEKHKPKNLFEDMFFTRNIEINKEICEKFAFQEKEADAFGGHQFWKAKKFRFSEIYEKLVSKKIYNFNILVRNTYRPKSFTKCISSIFSQEYEHYSIFMSYDDDRCLEYLKKYASYPNVNLFKVTPNLEKDCFYNLYCNELLNKVKTGWVIFLDDDDMFTNSKCLKYISQRITNDNDIVFWDFKCGKKDVKPDIYNIVEKTVASSSYTFNIKNRKGSLWKEGQLGDFEFLESLLHNNNLDRIKINNFFTKTVNSDIIIGNFGKKENNGILYTKIVGGLGNQMFMIFNIIALSKRYNKEFMLEYDESYIEDYKREKKCIRKKSSDYSIFNKLNFKEKNIVNLNIFNEKKYQYTNIFLEKWKNYDIRGYYQSYKYFWNYKEEIKKYLNIDYNLISTLKSKFKKKILAIHIRLGDYMLIPEFHPVCDIEYYKKALSYYDLNDFEVILFSDSPEEAKKRFSTLDIKFTMSNKICKNDEEEFYLLCISDVRICSNSTYSLMTCFLNEFFEFTRYPEYIFPKKWFGVKGPKYNIYDIIPLSKNFIVMDNYKETKSLTTIVTGYFKIKSKFTNERYKKWMKNMLSNIETPMIIFCDQETIKYIKSLRKDHNTLILETSIEKFLTYKYINDYRKHHNIDPEKKMHSPELYMVWAEKSEFLRKSILLNPFKSENFFWCDIGAFRYEGNRFDGNINPLFCKNWPCHEKMKKFDDKVYLVQMEHISGKYLESKDNKPIYNTCETEVSIGGGLFFGKAKSLLKWHKKFYEMLEYFISKSWFCGKDQHIMAATLICNRDFVELLIPPKRQFWFYLHYFLKRDPKVTVAIPTYNRFDRLLNTIESIKSQTYKNMEIIVVNDKSTEQKYYDYDYGDIKIINLEENSKQTFGFSCPGGYQRNFAIDQAKGEYIAFLDDDDSWLPHKIETQIKYMEEYDCGMSCTGCYWGYGIYDKTKKYDPYPAGFEPSHEYEIWKDGKLDKTNHCIMPTVMIRKDIIDKTGKFIIANTHEDYEYWKRTIKNTDCIYINKICAFYDRGHGGGKDYVDDINYLK